jgi:hypothetical protein
VLLEGPAIEPLLAQVRDEYGSGVRIISADKVRSGGVGGFFAKQHYELSVEVPDSNEDRNDMAKRTVPDNGQHTLERLLERAESQDRLDEPVRAGAHAAVGPPSARSAVPASFGTVRPGETTFPRPAARPAEARHAEQARPAEETMPETDLSRGAAFSDTGNAFAELMAGLDSTAEPGIERPRAKAGVPLRGDDAPTVRPFRPAATTETPINPHKPAAPALPDQLVPPAEPVQRVQPVQAAEPVEPVELVEPVQPARPVPSVQPIQPIQPIQPSLAERIGGLGASEVEVDEPPIEPVLSAAEAYGLAEPVAEPVAASIRPPITAPVTVPTTAPAPVAVTPVADSDPVIQNLIKVGMPEAMARRITGADTYAGVLSVLAARPAAPGIPDGPGEILVLAGDINLGVPLARHMLDQIGVPENHLLLAAPTTAGTGLHSSRLIAARDQAEARVEKLHNADQAWVVVMDAPVGGTDPLWVNEMCDAIGATAVWAVVDATRKTADTARHLRTLGEVEALVVHGVELTADPASVLGLDLPIYSLDGKAATPHAWAAMLCARIATDVTPVAAVPRRAARTVRQ